eukprot:jgi/Tetstr1/420510/TSEL_001054.t1
MPSLHRNADLLAAARVRLNARLAGVDALAYTFVDVEHWPGNLVEAYARAIGKPSSRSAKPINKHTVFMWKDVTDGSRSDKSWCYTTFHHVQLLFRLTQVLDVGVGGVPVYMNMRVNSRGDVTLDVT